MLSAFQPLQYASLVNCLKLHNPHDFRFQQQLQTFTKLQGQGGLLVGTRVDRLLLVTTHPGQEWWAFTISRGPHYLPFQRFRALIQE